MDRRPWLPALPERGCQVWWADPAGAAPRLADLLDDAERVRWSRFRLAPDRARYLVAHALARIVLAAFLDADPSRLRFSRECQHCGGPHGKPRLQGQAAPLELSISHSGQRVAVAVTRGVPVGIDVEHVRPQTNSELLAQQVLSPCEQAVLQQLPADDRLEGLLTYWTRKEALLKATGHGLAVPPRRLTVTAPAAAPRLLSWTAEARLDTPVHLHDLNPGPGHVACLAILGPQDLEVVELDAHHLLEGPGPPRDRP